jgi:hypothetical protein
LGAKKSKVIHRITKISQGYLFIKEINLSFDIYLLTVNFNSKKSKSYQSFLLPEAYVNLAELGYPV